MANISIAAKEFFETIEGTVAVMPETDGIEYLDIDVIEFTDQHVSNLFGDRYVIVYIIKDLDPKTDDELTESYYERSIGTSIFYPDHIKDKLFDHYGEQPLYIHKDTGMFISAFDYDAIDEDDDAERAKFDLYEEKTTDYAASTPQARKVMWEPLTPEEIEKAIEHAKTAVTPNLKLIQMMETSTDRPYSVNVFNNTISSFARTFATYEECVDLVNRIHIDKMAVVSAEMAFM
jgi:hypothetical protein